MFEDEDFKMESGLKKSVSFWGLFVIG